MTDAEIVEKIVNELIGVSYRDLTNLEIELYRILQNKHKLATDKNYVICRWEDVHTKEIEE